MRALSSQALCSENFFDAIKREGYRDMTEFCNDNLDAIDYEVRCILIAFLEDIILNIETGQTQWTVQCSVLLKRQTIEFTMTPFS